MKFHYLIGRYCVRKYVSKYRHRIPSNTANENYVNYSSTETHTWNNFDLHISLLLQDFCKFCCTEQIADVYGEDSEEMIRFEDVIDGLETEVAM